MTALERTDERCVVCGGRTVSTVGSLINGAWHCYNCAEGVRQAPQSSKEQLRACGHLKLFVYRTEGMLPFVETDVCQICEVERLTRERDEACNKLSALHEGAGFPIETECEPEDDPANAEIVAKLKAAFAGPPNERNLSRAMGKLADGAINANSGVAILTHAECDAIGKELRRLVRAARGENQAPHPYLCEATRFKLSFNRKGFTGALANFARDLDGRWVALVAAEDDCHMNGYLPVKSEARRPSIAKEPQ